MPVNKLEGSRINKIISSKMILKDVNFLCDKGEITGFVGPNGSGKSSLFKVLSGLWNINSGDIKLDGVSFINNIDEFIGNIGSFIESPNLYEDLTARQNFEIMIKLHNIQNLDWYNFLIFKFNIDSYIDKKIKKYSLGMKQRIAIVMALITNPDIIILDEPTNSLDITSVRILHEILQSVKKDKIILISSHILEELESIADKVYILKNGTIISSYSHGLNEQYTVELNYPINNDIHFSSTKILEIIDGQVIKIECSNLDEFLKECISLNISVKKVKNESSIKKFFDESIGEEYERFNKNWII